MEFPPLPAPERSISLDTLDAALFRELQKDGRASIQVLSAAVGVSRDVAAQRLHYLIEHSGLRIVAALDPSYVGHHLLTHATVEVAGPAGPAARDLAKLPAAVFVSLVTGAQSLVFEARHGSAAELHETLNFVRHLPSVRRVRVTTYGEILKGFFVSEQRGEISLDDLDADLITQLQHDGRTSYRALASLVHLSPSSVRARVKRMMDSGVIRISAIKAGGVSNNRFAIGIGIAAVGDTSRIREFILRSPAIDFAASAHGSYDFVATLVGPSAGLLLDALEELRGLPEVTHIDSWTHLDILKEDYARTLGGVATRSPITRTDDNIGASSSL